MPNLGATLGRAAQQCYRRGILLAARCQYPLAGPRLVVFQHHAVIGFHRDCNGAGSRPVEDRLPSKWPG